MAVRSRKVLGMGHVCGGSVGRRLARSLLLGLVALGLGVCPAAAIAKRPVAAKAKPKEKEPRLPPALQHLRQAVTAFHAGDYAAVRGELLPQVEGLRALKVADYALYLLGESEALLGDEQADRRLWQSAQQHLRAVAALADSPLALPARARAADCAQKLGKPAAKEAEAGYREVLANAKPSIDSATVRFRLAELAELAGKSPEARAALRKLYVEHPLHPLAETALARLHALDTTTTLAASEHLARAKNLIQNRRWPEAIAELQALPPDLAPALRDEVEYWLGTSFYRMRRNYEGAAHKLLDVAQRMHGESQAEAMFHGARALSRADKDDEAIKGYQAVVVAHPKSHFAPEASFLAGWLQYNRSRYAEAIVNLQDTLKRFSGPFAEEARWYIGLSRYLLGDYAGALPEFEALSKRSGTVAAKGTYWAGVALLKQGLKPAASERWQRLCDSQPLSYYGMLARVRLRDQGGKTTLYADAARRSAEGLPEWPKPGEPVDPKAAADPQLERARQLLSVGLDVEASTELRRVESALTQRYGASHALPVLFELYNRAQSFQRPHLLAEVHGAAALRRDPQKVPAVRPLWEAVYPLAYRAFIEKYGPSGDNPPRYLYSIMQKESAYNPHDVSYADAIGLLQMIPPTSRRVASHLDRPYTDDVLYDPEGNIQYGAWYIGRLLKKFKGQVALGAGSFNAGPAAMIRWLKRHGDRPLDEFIELCPYTQTREYMKKLLDIYAHYVYLWDGQEYLPSLQIDKDYLTGDGIDY
jgi:soluble lytic murein transglycosylase